jgi:hypothetical protein
MSDFFIDVLPVLPLALLGIVGAVWLWNNSEYRKRRRRKLDSRRTRR